MQTSSKKNIEAHLRASIEDAKRQIEISSAELDVAEKFGDHNGKSEKELRKEVIARLIALDTYRGALVQLDTV